MPRWDETKRAKHVVRLGRVAREAAMQSRRVEIPEVDVVESIDHFSGIDGLARADFGGIATNSAHRFVLVGPEGGWSPREQRQVPATVDLGPTVPTSGDRRGRRIRVFG